jgi:hypothetical protein
MQILQQFSISFQVVFGCDRGQEISPGFMQGIAQGGMYLVEEHIPPSFMLPGLPEIPVPQFQYRMQSGILSPAARKLPSSRFMIPSPIPPL